MRRSQPWSAATLTVTVSATGKLAPTNQVTVGSQLSGLVTRVVVDVNDRVTGGPAARADRPRTARRSDPPGARSSPRNQATGRPGAGDRRRKPARSSRGSRASTSCRTGGCRRPRPNSSAGRADYQRAVAALKRRAGNVTAGAGGAGADRQTQRQRAIIRSPVNGVVLARQVDPGQTVAASFNTPTLFVIAEDLSQMKLEVAIDEADVGEVKQGQKAQPSPSTPFRAGPSRRRSARRCRIEPVGAGPPHDGDRPHDPRRRWSAMARR
jgi:HlyD family secretion protein